MSERETIAIVSIGAVLPGVKNLEEFWQLLRDGKTVMRRPPAGRWILPSHDLVSKNPQPDRILSQLACFVEDWHCESDGLDIDSSLLSQLDPVFHIGLKASLDAWKKVNIKYRKLFVFNNEVMGFFSVLRV